MAEYVRIHDDGAIEEDDYRLIVSGEYMVIGDRYLPTWLEFESDGHDEPNHYVRIEIRNEVPQVVELGWRSRDSQREVRQKDIRDYQVASAIDVLYGMVVIEMRDGKPVLNLGTEGSEQDRAIRKFLNESLKGRRTLTSELARQVAEVYRANIDQAPTAAVAKTFGVKLRQASSYVQDARQRGYLPPTKQGKKQA